MDQVVVTSIVRDGVGYLDRYAGQVEELARLLGYRDLELVVMMGENDSSDGTPAWIMDWANKSRRAHVRLLHLHHGGPAFGSIDNPIRWRNIALTWNRLYAQIPTGARAAVYVETDLIWNPATILALIDDLATAPVVAPMVFLQRTNRFYDVWGFRRDGEHFDAWPPYHPALAAAPEAGLVRVDSAASCFVMRPEVAEGLTFSTADAMAGWSIYERGHSMWLNPRLRVYHP